MNHILSTSLSRLQCPNCWFVSSDLTLMKITMPCPSCGTSGQTRIGYPSLSALRLLDIIQHFYSVASTEHQDDLACTSEKIGRLLGRCISPRAAYTGWRKINRIYRQTRDTEDALETIERFFRCDRQNAMDVLQIYMTERARQPEQTVVPVLTVTLVETLLIALLRDLKVKRQGITYVDARRQVGNLRSFDERFAEFTSITGVDLPTTIQKRRKPFWDKWVYIRRKRNHFVHGNAYAIGWETCQRAYYLVRESIDLFTELNNRFVV
jgi:hypothetical protein